MSSQKTRHQKQKYYWVTNNLTCDLKVFQNYSNYLYAFFFQETKQNLIRVLIKQNVSSRENMLTQQNEVSALSGGEITLKIQLLILVMVNVKYVVRWND